MNNQKKINEEINRYYDNVILKIVSGVDYGFWPKLIDLIISADDVNYRKLTNQYKDLMDAIDRYNNSHLDNINSKLMKVRR